MWLLKKFISLLPTVCLLCGYQSKSDISICKPCLKDLPILSHYCPYCAQILPCQHCLKNPPPYDRTFALFRYEPPIVRLIAELKFKGQLCNAQLLGDLLTLKLKEWYKNQLFPDILIPIPLHPMRLKERGFNQALEIARPIAQAFNIPLDIQHCLRTKATPAQSGLSAIHRRSNVENAFTITEDYTGKHLAILDDVVTTKSTVSAFSQALKLKGADRIDIWCCARALVGLKSN